MKNLRNTGRGGKKPWEMSFTIFNPKIREAFRKEADGIGPTTAIQLFLAGHKKFRRENVSIESNLTAHWSQPDYEKLTAFAKEHGFAIPSLVSERIQYIDPQSPPEISTENPTVAQAMTKYMKLRQAGRVKNKKPIGERALSNFEYWIKRSNIKHTKCKDLNPSAVSNALDKVHAGHGHVTLTKRKNSTLNSYHSSLSVMLEWLKHKERGLLTINAAKEEKLAIIIEKDQDKTEYYEAGTAPFIQMGREMDEVARQDEFPKKTRKGGPNVQCSEFKYMAAALVALSDTAVRITFVNKLRVSNLHLDAKTRDGRPAPHIKEYMKGDKYSKIPMTLRAKEVFEWLLKQPMVMQSGYLFPVVVRQPSTTEGRHTYGLKKGDITHVGSWRARFKAGVEARGLQKSNKPLHAFRATVATEMANEGATAFEIKTQLGCTLETAMRYVRETNEQVAGAADYLNRRNAAEVKARRDSMHAVNPDQDHPQTDQNMP